MKKTLLISAVLLLLQACSQPHPDYTHQTTQDKLSAELAKHGGYVIIPGQAPVRVYPSDTNAAFDQQVDAYRNAVQSPVTTQPQPEVVVTQPQADPTPYLTPEQPQLPQQPDMQAGLPEAGLPLPQQPGPMQPAAAGVVDYTLKVTNNTNGRIFVEAQDAAGEIYPIGFMSGGISYTSKKERVAPIEGPITVVVRDPDQPGAPELRRYKVEPPANYQGKTIGINIISGGIYQVTLDGQVHYTSPTPTPRTVVAPAPAPEAAPAPAPIPEPTAAQPEPTPAGI